MVNRNSSRRDPSRPSRQPQQAKRPQPACQSRQVRQSQPTRRPLPILRSQQNARLSNESLTDEAVDVESPSAFPLRLIFFAALVVVAIAVVAFALHRAETANDGPTQPDANEVEVEAQTQTQDARLDDSIEAVYG